jgi:hypothetical protein
MTEIVLADGPLAGQRLYGTVGGDELWACGPVVARPWPGPYHRYRYHSGRWIHAPAAAQRT